MRTERGASRRNALLNAAVHVVARAGLRGLTHRAVDAQAGLTEGTTSASFRTRLALLTALADHVAARLLGDVELLSETIAHHAQTTPGDHPFAIGQTQRMVTGWLAEPDVLAARLELSLEAARQPDLAATFRPWRAHLNDVIEQLMSQLQIEEPRLRAETAVAGIEGLLVAALAEPPPTRKAQLERQTALLLGSLVADARAADV